jgi:hypothetical protein
VIGLFDWPITGKKKEKKRLKFEHSQSRFIVGFSFGLPIGYKRRTLGKTNGMKLVWCYWENIGNLGELLGK